ncbi:predicted protein [Chaetomium globosum CBS 148.51]|uniref:ATP-dependent DNA helicase PIF1 n=1 Tax=Chaetomium globosum (strain ATCC 6205 / CBS 148.51 / DSM 1962 / NBRC 6347 / NRRL 1970) TaxID=306901 RepID=Q2H4K3_CHAGB|nr:uncharacterized protein CHGG_06412 [Chaetomium globosum CBS 148.51]EAQ89793.1 predicted protein [Chaetomium globosum CBS 148.51]
MLVIASFDCRSMEDVIGVLAGTVEAAAEAAVARKTCSRCNTEQNIDQFLHARRNGRIVVNCLSCRHKSKLHVIILVTILFSSANLSQVEASRASIEISRAIARGDDSSLAFAPALAPGPRRNLTHGVLAEMYHERGRVSTDTPETAAARDQRLTIQRRHGVERRHGVQPSQTPSLSSLIGREQQLNAEDEAPTTSRCDLLPVQAAEGDDLGGNADDLRRTLPRRGRPPKRRSPSTSSARSRGRPRGRPRLARNPVGRPRTQNFSEDNPPREFDEPAAPSRGRPRGRSSTKRLPQRRCNDARDDLKDIEIVGRNAYLSFDKSVFLTTIQRQQGEDQAPFRRALEELRKADVSVPSWELLASRCSVKLSPEEVDSFADALRIYPTKTQVVEYSHQHMLGLDSPAIQVEAKHEGVGAEKVESSNAGNLAKRLPFVIMVAFDDYDGPAFTMPNEEPLRSGEKLVVPILRVRQDFMVGANSCSREQFPLLVSYAITVHKSQGITLDKVVCDISAPEFASGLSYVAVSRVKTLGGLMFEKPFDRNRIYRETPSRAMGLKLSNHAIRQRQALDAVAGKDPSEAQRSQ